jgi:hypothetical protein
MFPTPSSRRHISLGMILTKILSSRKEGILKSGQRFHSTLTSRSGGEPDQESNVPLISLELQEQRNQDILRECQKLNHFHVRFCHSPFSKGDILMSNNVISTWKLHLKPTIPAGTPYLYPSRFIRPLRRILRYSTRPFRTTGRIS